MTMTQPTLRTIMLAFGAVMLAGMLVACDEAPEGAGGDMGGAPPAAPTQ